MKEVPARSHSGLPALFLLLAAHIGGAWLVIEGGRSESLGLVLAGIVIPGICAWNGVQAVAQGQNLGRYIGYGIGGMALCFGGAYILSQGGISATTRL